MAATRTAEDERSPHQPHRRRVRVAGELGPAASVIAYLLGGYAVLMVLAQLPLSLIYSRLS